MPSIERRELGADRSRQPAVGSHPGDRQLPAAGYEPTCDRRARVSAQKPLARLADLTRAGWTRAWPILRATLGWCCLIIGVLGIILPIIPGLPFLVPGIALVGRRTWILRWVSVHCKRALRRWAPLHIPLIGPVGRWALGAQHQLSRQRRRLAWWQMERRSRK